MTRLRLFVISAVALVFGVALPATPASALAPAAVDAKVGTLALRSQTPWVGAGGTFELRIAKPAANAVAASDLEYALSVYPSSPTRSAFARTLTTRPTTSPLAVVATSFAEAANDSGGVTLDIGVQDPTQPRDRTRVTLRSAGVYPTAVELRTTNGVVLSRLLTHLIYVPETPDGPKLAVGLVVPIRAPLALQPNGSDALAAADITALNGVAAALATLPTTGVFLAPSPETLAALSRATTASANAAIDAWRRVAATHAVIPSPFVATQAPEATTFDRGASARRGVAVITASLGVAPSLDLSVLQEPNDDRLANEPDTTHVAILDQLLAPVTQRVTAAEPVAARRSNAKTSVPALVVDSALSAHFDGASPILAAHHLLADLATIYFDNPGRFRSIIVVPSGAWRPSAQVLTPFLAGLASSPILGASDLDRLLRPATAKSTPRTRVILIPPTPPIPPNGFASLRRTIRSLTAVMSDSPGVAQRFADRLLIAESAQFNVAQRRNYVDGLRTAVTNERRKFMLPNGGSITLTARRGAIPITVRSTAGYAAHVVLQVASDRLMFPGGTTRVLTLTRHDTTQRFPIQSLGSGNFPVRILLKSPDGRVVLGEARLTVHSTNVSGVGIALSVGAGLFLLVWWYRHSARGRRARVVVE